MTQSPAYNRLSWRELFILLAGRWTLNTAFRVVYAILPFIATSFMIDQRTASLLVTIQVGAALASPLGGTLADRRGERETMLWGLGMFCVGALICALASRFVPFVLGYGLIGLGTALYHPAGQSYASARTPYAQRGRVLGILELSWAFSALLGVSLLTQTVKITDSRSAVFVIQLSLGLLVLVATFLGLRNIQHHSDASEQSARRINARAFLQPHVIGALALAFGMILGTELIFVAYATWLERDFGATIAQAGLVFSLLGVVEFVGSGGSALIVDRLGKRRSVLAGLALCGLTQALLPFSAGNWPLFLVLFLLFDLAFEYAIVSYFPLISGAVPQARGTILSISVAVIGAGRVIGSLLGPLLWINYGFIANGLYAALISLVSLVVGFMFLREGEQ